MVIKLMNIVVKPLIKPFSESFFSKNGIFAQENERLNISELPLKIASEFWILKIRNLGRQSWIELYRTSKEHLNGSRLSQIS